MESSSGLASIKFIVVGGGISGLACGYVLRQAGHQVVILEKAAENFASGGSIRSPPNMTRILKKWPGMEALFEKCATKCFGISFRRAATSEPVGFLKFHKQIMLDLEADFLVLQYDALHRHLASLCVAAGVALKYGCAAINAQRADDGSAIVHLEDGSLVEGDIVIGADGHNSLVRAIVAEDELERTHVVTGMNIRIPTKVVKEYQELKPLCNTNEFTIWMGNGSTAIGTLDYESESFDIALCSPMSLGVDDGDWASGSSATMPFDLSGYDPSLRKLILLGSTCRPTVQQVLQQEDVVGLKGIAVSVGDAAHSVLIHGMHNSAMGIEDAETLGRLFSGVTDRTRIPMLLNAYQEIRHPRTTAAQDSEYQSLEEISLPTGIAQEARDTALRTTLIEAVDDFDKCSDSTQLMQIWEQYLVLFAHSPSEAVDNWRSMWGRVVDDVGHGRPT
ncbi:hypothetical protein C8F04DRAFT_1069282 [Mycena alexandri]|uniref:FAD-binding domain-containing protein n=1 Tax=Mycena alexandri TaxID=1745969 RepID=A0AAD6TEH6_9AGAR|nr:hypothetical protein C8F04DRAFT_1069282 [Mycena alexandri]